MLRLESLERDERGRTLLHAAVEGAGGAPKTEHALALAELMAPEALLLTNRLRLTPVGLAVINKQDRLVDALERAVLARLKVAPPLSTIACPHTTTSSQGALDRTITSTTDPSSNARTPMHAHEPSLPTPLPTHPSPPCVPQTARPRRRRTATACGTCANESWAPSPRGHRPPRPLL